ncbi:MAG: phosphate ABC transporter permease PstA [Cytophagaceae bacterium]|nr:phosphate ABC transporter permease PstA [Cytophagaceae bacterium]
MKEKKKLKKRLKYFPNSRYYDIQDTLFKYFGLACTLLGVIILSILIIDLVIDGASRINWDFISGDPSTSPEDATVMVGIVGTLWIMLFTALIALPIGISAGIYLEEYGKRSKFASIIEINIANLAGVPSIIYGLLGLEIFVRMLHLGESILAGSLTLALLILPIVIVSTREALKGVPYSLREASYALGATKWQTIWDQVLPAAGGGILTGVILSMSRAVGETAPLIVVGAATFVTASPNGPMDDVYTVLPMQIYNWVGRPEKEFIPTAAGAIIVLLIITFLMNGLAIFMRQHWQRKVKW